MEIFFVSIAATSAIFGFICIFLALKIFIEFMRKRKLASNVAVGNSSNVKINNSGIASLLRNGIPFFEKPSKLVLEKAPAFNQCIQYIVQFLDSRGVVSKEISVTSSLFGIVLSLAILVALIFRSPIAGIAVVVFAVLCLFVGIKSSVDKQKESIRTAVPDALNTMIACSQTGFTLNQTFDHLKTSEKGLIKNVFADVSHVLSTGGTIPQALEKLKGDNSCSELTFVALSLDVQHQTGGSIRPVLETAKDMVESRLELLAHLKVQTAQAKLSARVVTLLPFGLVAVFSVISPDFLKPFFSSFLGFIIFAVACIMQASGVLLVRKMLKVNI